MGNEYEAYINKVLNCIGIRGRKAAQIREDIYASLVEKRSATGENDPYVLMGNPQDVADEFRENLGIEDKCCRYNYWCTSNFEYISKKTVFGIPLVHINGRSFGVAKGIIAVGTVSVGVISIGAISAGLISIGALAFGLLMAFGGGAVSGILSAGGFAVSGIMSIGGLAAAKCFAAGGFAAADIAVGGITRGIVGIFRESGTGTYLFRYPAGISEVSKAVKHVYPVMGDFIMKLLKYFI